MGNKSQQKKNKLIDTAGSQAQAQSKQLGGYGAEDRAYSTSARDDINSKYNDLYSGLDSGDGGGGGGYTPSFADARENEAMEGYRNFANTGGFDTNQMQDFRGRATSTLPSFYSTLQDQMENQNRQSGGYNVGYNAQTAKLARDKAYGANQVSMDAEAGLQDQIRNNKFKGLEGVGQYDTEFMNNQRQVEAARQAAAGAASSRQRNSADDNFRNRMAILSEQRGLRGEAGSDLPYWELQQGATGQQLGAANAREVEKSGWDKAGSIAKTVGRGVAAFYSGGLSEGALGLAKKFGSKGGSTAAFGGSAGG